MDEPDWYFRGENFDTLLNDGLFVVSNSGPLHGPVKTFKISRDDHGKLILETFSDGDSAAPPNPRVPGTLFQSRNVVEFVAPYASAKAIGVEPANHYHSENYRTGVSTNREISQIHQIEILIQPEAEEKYLFEWIQNLDSSVHLPSQISCEEVVTQRFEFRDNSNPITAEIPTSMFRGGSNFLPLTINGSDVYVCRGTNNDRDSKCHDGFILYSGAPSDDERLRIREVLSFFLGRYLIYLGYSTYDDKWMTVRTKAVASYSLDGKAFTMVTQTPAPIATPGWRFVDQSIADRFVSALLSNYEQLDFLHLSWAYWHGMTATSHIAGVHFGALVESLQRRYQELHPSRVTTAVMDKAKWRKIRDALSDLLPTLDLAEEEVTLVTGKIGELNQIPNGMILQRVYSSLQLNMSAAEINAWKTRNSAAHGKATQPEDVLDQIRDNKRLRLLFIRLLLAITSASDHYIDDCSLHHPVRPLQDPVP
jgi:hypothetical protein